jgi:cytochrome b6-f complex iron-sulfur subunit
MNPPTPTRRAFSSTLALAWGALSACSAILLHMLHDFLAPKVLREPRRLWRAGKLEEFSQPGSVFEQFKKTPDGAEGFWIINLAPDEPKLVAVSTLCTHLGCIPNWQPADRIFACPCHGSAYDIRGINFQGPAPRPLERYAISIDDDGYVVVDQTRVFRKELAQWDNPDSFVQL